MTHPLIGDADGIYRIHLVGNSGSGKTTLGRDLALILNVSHISLDALYFTPGWGHVSTSELRARLKQALADAPQGWVVDGNYGNRIGNIVQSRSTDIVWLDPPLVLALYRVLVRTVLGLLGRRAPCAPGCPERWTTAFCSRESVLWWCLTRHAQVRRRFGGWMEEFGISASSSGMGDKRRKMRRIGGWGGELRAWLEDVGRMVQQRRQQQQRGCIN
ncbi:hypothetical protein C8R46DRAFT_1293941 [Mycena filopes]|nr:hypothetical protein C8R46DRAFT_1293941 [Mycena filopes]